MRSAILFLVSCAALAQQVPPDDIQRDQAWIVSEGTRMHADIFFLKANGGRKLPTVLLAHGWGGNARALWPDAIVLARAGYYAVAFDYRGWGESESRLIPTGPVPQHKKGEKFTVEVREVREVVDPLDFGADWLNAIHWASGELMCDINRLGLWGSSFSGGLVVWAAARDSRVKSVHSQVGAFDGRELAYSDKKKFFESSMLRARGEIGYPAPLAVEVGKLRGAPILSRFADYAPVDDIERANKCAVQIVIAEKEELFDNKNHGIKAYERHKGAKRLVTVPNILHYGIYYEARKQAQELAVEWFDKTLKGN